MTDDELKKIEKLCSEATPGPWHIVEKPWLRDNDSTWVIAGHFDPHIGEPVCQPLEHFEIEEGQEDNVWTQDDVNMQFIAEAREALPKLLKELKKDKRRLNIQRNRAEIAEKAFKNYLQRDHDATCRKNEFEEQDCVNTWMACYDANIAYAREELQEEKNAK